jgi:hypothetical protein
VITRLGDILLHLVAVYVTRRVGSSNCSVGGTTIQGLHKSLVHVVQ